MSNRVLHADRGLNVETGGLVTIGYQDGVVATIDCSWSYPDSAPTWGELTLQLVGTKGTATISPFQQHIGGYDANGAIWVPSGDNLSELAINEFITAIQVGQSPQPDGIIGLRTLQIVLAALRSAQDGQPITLAEG